MRLMLGYGVLQCIAIVAAAAATVVAVNGSWDNNWIAAIPAAAATLAVTLLATFRLEEHWLRCRRAESDLDAEIALFESGAGPYQGLEEPERTDRFVVRTVRISRAGDEIDPAAKPAESY